jgi:hypothetical protein
MNPNKNVKLLDQSSNETLIQYTGEHPPVYATLYPTKEKEKELKAAFYESGCMEDPDLRPTEIDLAGIESRVTSLREAKIKILEDSTSTPEIKQVYRWKVNEEIANLLMVVASKSGNQRNFDRWNRFIYGDLDPQIFASVCTWYRGMAIEHMDSPKQDVREAASQVLDVIPGIYNDPSILSPDESTFELIKEQEFAKSGFFEKLTAGIELDDNETVSETKGLPLVRRMLDNIGAQNYPIVFGSGQTWSASHNPPQLTIPEKYSLTSKRFIGLAAHELTHIIEAIDGAVQPVELLRQGLDRNESGNEGRALIREQVLYPKFEDFTELIRWQEILRRYVAIGLGSGITGEKLSFSKVYQVINSMDRLTERIKNDDKAIADKKADNRSWNLLNRVLKATDGKGGAYYKDKVYLEGNIACWSALKSSPGLMEAGDFGKFDITNPRHIQLLQETGILPITDLEEF